MAAPPSTLISAMPWVGPFGQITRTPLPQKSACAVSPAFRLNDSVRSRSSWVQLWEASAWVHSPAYTTRSEASSMTGSTTRNASTRA